MEPSEARASAVKHNQASVLAATSQQYWQGVLFLALVDNLIHDRFLVQYLISTHLGALDRDTTRKTRKAYTNESSDRRLRKQDRTVESEMGCRGGKPIAKNLKDTVSCKSEDRYLIAATVFTILLTTPVSTAPPARLFSIIIYPNIFVYLVSLSFHIYYAGRTPLPLMHVQRETPPECVITDFCAMKTIRL